MKKGVILSVLFLIALSYSVSAAVVINEVEANPAGSDSGNEWVELYNDGADVNLSGWYLQDEEGDNFSLDTMISDFYVFDFSGLQLVNSDEEVKLFDETGFLIDSSGIFSDSFDDDTWSRNPDGSGAFVFQAASKGVSNVPGDITVNGLGNYTSIQDAIDASGPGDVINVAAGTYTEDLSIDKSVDIFGEDSASTFIEGAHIISVGGVDLDGFTFVSGSSTAIVLDSSSSILGGINIMNSIFDLTSSSSVGINVGGENPVNKVADLVMDNLVFNGPVDMVCNPWKIGGSFGSPLSVEIDGLDFLNSEVNRCSIPINLHNRNIKEVLIDNNTFRNTDGVVYVWNDIGSDPSGILSKFVFSNNDVDSSNSYGVGIDTAGNVFKDSNFGSGNKISNNNFIGIPGRYGFNATSILANLTSYKLDARNNLWGDCSGPASGYVSANVLFDPWLGICTNNIETCSIEGDDALLSADISGDHLDEVIFKYWINGVAMNGTGNPFINGSYSFSIPESQLSAGNSVTWTAYAIDTFGNVFNESLLNFGVKGITDLNIVPAIPNGLNGWYINEPILGLAPDPSADATYYQWDSLSSILYTPGTLFGFDDIPDNVTLGGSLTLKYWSEFDFCEETIRENSLMLDLSDPLVTDIIPSDGSLVIHNLRPTISALLDDRFQSNSGINESGVTMRLDGNTVAAVVNELSDTKTEISFDPDNDLALGNHVVTARVTDNAGRNAERTWSFEILDSPPFDLMVNSPTEGLYTNRRVVFNLTLTEEGKIEFINYNDRNPRWRRLCRNCDNYGGDRKRMRSVNEGENNISFRGSNDVGGMDEENVFLVVDSKDPKIRKTSPTRGFTSGFFEVEFQEDNPDMMYLNYGQETDMRTEEVDLGTCYEDRRNMKCNVTVDLGDFENEEVLYWFNLSDIVGNFDESRVREVEVDSVAPIVDYFNYTIDGRRVNFIVNVTETNFDKITYIDFEDDRPRERSLCSRLRENQCEKRKTFRRRDHDLTLHAYDEAGNIALVEEHILFDVL